MLPDLLTELFLEYNVDAEVEATAKEMKITLIDVDYYDVIEIDGNNYQVTDYFCEYDEMFVDATDLSEGKDLKDFNLSEVNFKFVK